MSSSPLSPKGYESMAQVVALQNIILRYISGDTHSGIKNNKVLERVIKEIKEKEKQQLMIMLKIYQEKEKQLLSAMGFNGNNVQSQLNSIASKIRKWNESGASALINNDALASRIASYIAPANTMELEALIEQALNVNSDLVIKALFNNELEKYANLLTSNIVNELKNALTTRKTSGPLTLILDAKEGIKTGGETSKGKKFTTTLETRAGITVRVLNNNKLKVNITGSMPSEIRKTLVDELEKIIKNGNGNAQVRSVSSRIVLAADKIQTAIEQYLPVKAKPKTRRKIMDVVKNYVIGKEDIALNRNKNVVKGALGEIYWTAFFEYLGLETQPVGVKYLGDGKELPVDIVVSKIFGFQVKNYTTEKNANGDLLVYFNRASRFDKQTNQMIKEAGSVSLLSFFSQIPNNNAELMGRFFFSEKYNKWNKKEDEQGVYRPVEERFPAIRKGIVSYIEANPYPMLNLSRQVNNIVDRAGQSISFPNDVLTKPVVYLINDYFIPVSYMIQDMIDSLDGSINADTISIKAHDVSIETQDISSVWPYAPEKTPQEFIANCKIHYYLEVNLSRLFSRMIGKK